MCNRPPTKQEIQHLELCKRFFFYGRPHVLNKKLLCIVADRYFVDRRVTLSTSRGSVVPNIVSADVEIQYFGPEVRSQSTLEGG